VFNNSNFDVFDMISEVRSYKTNVDALLAEIMNECKIQGQHHIKLDFAVDSITQFRASYRTLDGINALDANGGGVHPIFSPYIYTYNKGIYAISKDRSKTIYIGANDAGNRRNCVYDRILAFGKAVYNRMHQTESHPAGKRYRSIYGENTDDLYLSFLFYDQFTDNILDKMNKLNLQYSDIEYLMIKKFSSQYLLNRVGR